jgi:hypothetical protein
VEIALVALLFAGGLALRLSLAHDYVFAGSDSYGYLKLADEWREHGRYALGPSEPLYYARPPLYAAFVAAVKRDARAEMSGGEGWGRIVHAQLAIDLLVTGVLIWWLGRRLGGRWAGVVALGFAMTWPFTLITVGAALTECVAMALAACTVAPLALAAASPEWSTRRRRVAFAAAGVAYGLSVLTRPDGLLLGFAFVPAALAVRGWRERALVATCAVLGFAVAFGPWPARNLVRFGRAYALGTRVDRKQHPIEHADGGQRFIAAYGRDWRVFNWFSGCAFEPTCAMDVTQFERDGAVDGPEDRARLLSLLAERARFGFSESVSRGFDELARGLTWRHPLRAFVWLPLRRGVQMWGDDFDEIFQKPPIKWLYFRTRGALPALSIAFLVALVACAVLAWRFRRAAAAVLLAAIVGRTAVLAYTFYTVPRYDREVMPLAFVVIAVGAVLGAERLLALRRRAAS